MRKILNIFIVIKNNWKKSLFAAACATYGINYAKNAYDNKQLMHKYCVLAAKYGDVINPATKPFRNVTVLVNPAANNSNSKNKFEKYCAPLLHLAGLAVTIVYTEYAGQAKDIADSLDPKTDVLVIAGGDGTLSETITGLLRRVPDNEEVLKGLPLGLLPLGKSNSLANALLGNKKEVQALADSTMAVIDGSLQAVDVMKIKPIVDEGNSKPVYGVAQLQWGSFRNANANRDKYWYFGGLRGYASHFFTNIKEAAWECKYTQPCKGCNKCIIKPEINRHWWSFFMPNPAKTEVDYSNVVNEDCGKINEKEVSTVDLIIKTATISKGDSTDAPHLLVSVIPGTVERINFLKEGWRRLRGKQPESVETTAVKELDLFPKVQDEDDWLSIDSENYEVKPIKISILPKAINIFQPRKNGYI